MLVSGAGSGSTGFLNLILSARGAGADVVVGGLGDAEVGMGGLPCVIAG